MNVYTQNVLRIQTRYSLTIQGSPLQYALAEHRVDATVYKLVLGDVELKDKGPHHFFIVGSYIQFSASNPAAADLAKS